MRRILIALALLPGILVTLFALAPGVAVASTPAAQVRVGTEGTYPPFSYQEGGKLTGYAYGTDMKQQLLALEQHAQIRIT